MIGSQTPRLRIEPNRLFTDGNAAAALMEAYGVPLAEWQRLVLDCWLGKDLSGNYTVTSGGLSTPWQNGKNVCFEARELFGLLIKGEHIMHTAHQVVTSKKSFARLERMFTNRRHPEIQKRVKYIRYTNGEECIVLNNGGVVEFSARSRQRARGFDGVSLVVFDEAQELTDDQADAILPTLSASATGTRQVLYGGTPPYPGCPGTVFWRFRNQVTTNAGPHEAWHEWSVPAKSVSEIDTANSALWFQANPGLGLNLDLAFTGEELRRLTPDGFARERLGWWSPELQEAEPPIISAAAWDACRSEALKPEGKTAYGIKFTFDGSQVILCGAVIPNKGPARVSLIEARPTGHGTQWLANWLNARHGKAACVVIDGRNGADVLVDKIAGTWHEKDAIIRPSASNILAATSMMIDAVNEQTISWFYGNEALRESAVSSTKRKLSGGWTFGGDLSAPIEAASLALWGAKTSKRDPSKTMRIG